MMSSRRKKVCVTGGTGFIASTLIKQLVEKGYLVNTTVRDPENLSKVSHLKKLDTIGLHFPLSLFTGDERMIGGLKAAQRVSGVISIVHVVDVCRAHIFAAETESASGRYICASMNMSLPELAAFLSKRYPQYDYLVLRIVLDC